MTDEQLRSMLSAEGYRELREVPGRGLCGIMPMMFTIGLFYGLSEYGYDGRYCYAPENIAKLLSALLTWDGAGHPDGPWIKHKGHGIEETNPTPTLGIEQEP